MAGSVELSQPDLTSGGGGGLSFETIEETEWGEDGRVTIPWGLKGTWRLTFTPDDLTQWMETTVEFQGGKHPTRIAIPRLASILRAPVTVSSGSVGDITMSGTWRSGSETGAVYGELVEDEDDDVFQLTMPQLRDDATVQVTLRMIGYRPIVIGPVKLKPGDKLALGKLHFERD